MRSLFTRYECAIYAAARALLRVTPRQRCAMTCARRCVCAMRSAQAFYADAAMPCHAADADAMMLRHYLLMMLTLLLPPSPRCDAAAFAAISRHDDAAACAIRLFYFLLMPLITPFRFYAMPYFAMLRLPLRFSMPLLFRCHVFAPLYCWIFATPFSSPLRHFAAAFAFFRDAFRHAAATPLCFRHAMISALISPLRHFRRFAIISCFSAYCCHAAISLPLYYASLFRCHAAIFHTH